MLEKIQFFSLPEFLFGLLPSNQIEFGYCLLCEVDVQVVNSNVDRKMESKYSNVSTADAACLLIFSLTEKWLVEEVESDWPSR